VRRGKGQIDFTFVGTDYGLYKAKEKKDFAPGRRPRVLSVKEIYGLL